MSCGIPIWQLLKECAEKLTKEGKVPFSRRNLIDCIKKTHPDIKEMSINPIIQGITVNAKGGAPGSVGKKILFRVERGRFILYDLQENKESYTIQNKTDISFFNSEGS